jgi:hypothetical protein
VLGGGLLLSLWAAKTSDYEAPMDPNAIVVEIDTSNPSDAEFYSNRIADLVVAYNRNSLVNDKKATQLAYATYCFVVGIVLHVTYLIIILGWRADPPGGAGGRHADTASDLRFDRGWI